MSHTSKPILGMHNILATLVAYRRRWIIPAAVIAGLTLVYAVVHTPTWQASIAILVRDEAIGRNSRLGRFLDADDMRTQQETILELVKSRAVVKAALEQIGPPSDDRQPSRWPQLADVEKTRKNITVKVPNGAAFGTTEVFYLQSKGADQRRAIQLADTLFQCLDRHFRRLRNQKAHGLVEELTKTTRLAQSDLDPSLGQLAALEHEMGVDLGELRILNESSGGESNLRRTLVEVQNELRQAGMADRSNSELLGLLVAAQASSDRLIATPNRLLLSQPALRRIKDGLVDAQLVTSRLLGDRTDEHPQVMAARTAEHEVRRHMHQELGVAIQGISVERRLAGARIEELKNKVSQLQGRMNRVADVRAEYQNLLAETRQRREILGAAQRDLAEARSSLAATQSTSLISRLDGPQTGEFPLGPSRTMIVVLGLVGGILVGWGIVFLTVKPTHTVSPMAHPGSLHFRGPSNGHQRTNGSTENTVESLSFQQALSRLSRRGSWKN